MKSVEELHVAILDYGTFIGLADGLSKKCKRVSYHSPHQQEYLGIDRCVIGDGMERFERVDEYLDPEFFNSVDLWVFPDIEFGGLQKYLRSIGKLVWGSMGASDLELFRTKFLKVVKEVGLEMVNSVPIFGLTRLADHLKDRENVWVKINRYRDNKETFHWQDWVHGQRDLEQLACAFGPLKDHVWFVVQDAIEGDDDQPVLEFGYDGLMVTSPDRVPQYPKSSFAGYEKKNELYLGSLLPYTELPEEVQIVNEKFGPVLAEYGYRNFWATEIRKKGDKFYFIDPTARMAGQTMEHQFENMTNLPEVLLAGAQGILVEPEFEHDFAAEATLHYKGCEEGWKTFVLAPEQERWVKLYRCCKCDGAYQYPPHKSNEVGVVLGLADGIEESIDDLKKHFEAIKDEPVSVEMAGFADLLEQIKDAENEDVKFSDQPVPPPEIAVRN